MGLARPHMTVYASGVSQLHPADPAQLIRRWAAALDWSSHGAGCFHIRLSLDPFHEEHLGLQPIVGWIAAVEESAPWWRVSLRALQLEGYTGPSRLAAEFRGHSIAGGGRSGMAATGSGREIPVDLKGFAFDGRGSAGLLSERGLALPSR